MYRELRNRQFRRAKDGLSPDIEFQDPLHHVSGIVALTRTSRTSTDHWLLLPHRTHLWSERWSIRLLDNAIRSQTTQWAKSRIEVQGHNHIKMLDNQSGLCRDYLDVGSVTIRAHPSIRLRDQIHQKRRADNAYYDHERDLGISQSLAIDYAQQRASGDCLRRNPTNCKP